MTICEFFKNQYDEAIKKKEQAQSMFVVSIKKLHPKALGSG